MSMPSIHPATQRVRLQQILRIDRTVTTVQLGRWDLLQAAERLGLPQVIYSCRTRITQSDSTVNLTFVALDDVTLDRAPRDLMHDAGLAEARAHHVLESGAHWRHVTLRGRARLHLPDAEIIGPDLEHTRDWAVEFDAGYSRKVIREKVQAMCAQGYTRLLWASSIHDRTRSVQALVRALWVAGDAPGLEIVETRFCDFWTADCDPYRHRPRNAKALHQLVVLRPGLGNTTNVISG